MILMKLVKWRLKRVTLAAELNVIILQYQSWFYSLIFWFCFISCGVKMISVSCKGDRTTEC